MTVFFINYLRYFYFFYFYIIFYTVKGETKIIIREEVK